jgi:hypothetical protein
MEWDMDALVPASMAARAANVSKQLFNYWRRSGKVKPAGERNGHALYRLGDVLKVESETRRAPQSHRAA